MRLFDNSINKIFKTQVCILMIAILLLQIVCISLQTMYIFDVEKNNAQNVVGITEEYLVSKIKLLQDIQDHNIYNKYLEVFLQDTSNEDAYTVFEEMVSYIWQYGDKSVGVVLFDNIGEKYVIPNNYTFDLSKFECIYKEFKKNGQTFFVTQLTDYLNDYYFVSLKEISQNNLDEVGKTYLGVNFIAIPINTVKMTNDIYLLSKTQVRLVDRIEDKTVFNIFFQEEKNRSLFNHNYSVPLFDTVYQLEVEINYDPFKSKLFMVNLIMIMSMFILLLLLIPFTSVITKRLIVPIQKMRDFLSNWRITSSVQTLEMNACREVNDITEVINAMVINNKQLMRDVFKMQEKLYEQELIEKQTRFDYLKLQINPHFLYNTLECIKAIAVVYKADEIDSIVMSLSNILRYSLKPTTYAVVGEEIDILKSYFSIYNIRMGDKFEVSYNIEEKTFDYQIIKFIFQPLIENSIKHGFKGKNRYHLVIEGYVHDEVMVFNIIDDGCGISSENLLNIKQKLNSYNVGKIYSSENNKENIGLSNVNERIKIHYGNEYGIDIDSVEGEFTKVTVTIPIK